MKELVVISGKGGTGKTSIVAAFAALVKNAVLADCDVDAITFNDHINGQWFVSDTRFGPMVHAKLGIAEENSGKQVTLLRKEAKQIAQEQKKDLLIVDGSPGIGCPVIASITAADLVLVVTEPTRSGKHDLDRVSRLTENFGIETLVCVNKADVNPRITDQISEGARKRGFKVIGKIAYDDAFTKAQMIKASVVEYTGGAITEQIKALWRQVTYALG